MQESKRNGRESAMLSDNDGVNELQPGKRTPDFEFPQNFSMMIGDTMFGDQAVNATMADIRGPIEDEYDGYSHTGNSWNQSDIDSDYHRYDPRMYPSRPPKPKNPQESDSFRGSSKTGTAEAPHNVEINTVTSFGEILQRAKLASRLSKGSRKTK